MPGAGAGRGRGALGCRGASPPPQPLVSGVREDQDKGVEWGPRRDCLPTVPMRRNKGFGQQTKGVLTSSPGTNSTFMMGVGTQSPFRSPFAIIVPRGGGQWGNEGQEPHGPMTIRRNKKGL